MLFSLSRDLLGNLNLVVQMPNNNRSKLTLADIASLAGVSTSTASRALKDNPVINKDTRSRVQSIAAKNHFTVNATASRLRTRKNNVIAVILNIVEETEQNVNDPFLLKMVSDLNVALNDAGYELLLSNSIMASQDWSSYFIESQRADGLIVIGQGKNDDKLMRAADAKVPLVVWGDPSSLNPYSVVGSNNRLGGQIATSHLIKSGRRSLIYLGDHQHAEISERYKGFAEIVNSYEGVNATLLDIDITSSSAYHKISDELKAKGLYFDGIVAASDMVAIGAIKALKERYISVPKDVGIIGFDGIQIAELIHPALSTVVQNTEKAAKTMVGRLLDAMNGNITPESNTIELNLVKRETT